MNASSHRPKISSEIRERVARNMSREIEFYEFCKKRLIQQMKEMNEGK